MSDIFSSRIGSRAARSMAQRIAQRIAWRIAGCAVLVLGTACGGLLDVSDPTLVQDKDIANASGADSRRLDVVVNFHPAAIRLANDVALFTDERIVDLPLTRNDVSYYLDRRDGPGYEALARNQDPHLGGWDDIVNRAAVAIPKVRAYSADSLKGDYLAQLYAYRGYAILQMAEDICSGFPINEVVDQQPAFSGPFTTDSAVKYALAQLDSVLAEAHDSTDLINFARVLRGRAYLDLKQYTQAAAAVADVPTEFSYQTLMWTPFNYFYVNGNVNYWKPTIRTQVRFAVGDTEGTNGLPFVSAHDPRVPSVYKVVRINNPHDSLYDQLKYPSKADPMVLAGGIEARLIEAEAALNAGDPSWFDTLNMLRSTMISPAMDAIPVMPATTKDQVDLLYRERAFWLYLTGRRLGDL